MKIGILSAGGDCPAINATIRSLAKIGISYYGMDVYGIKQGFQGLIDNNYIKLDENSLSGLLTAGGTFLGTSRIKPFKKKDITQEKNIPEIIKKNIKKKGFDCVVCIGGNGTQKTANKMREFGINVVHLPKTIDNDIYGTDMTFGFDSAVQVATDAIDRIHSTASSHNRAMVVEVMGHKAGWLALHAGMAAGGDIILVPEFPYDIEVICETLEKRAKQGKKYSIIVVAEGIKTDGYTRAAEYISKIIETKTGIESRQTVLGYLQRGGAPSAYDRNLATRMGAFAAKIISEKKFGNTVCLRGETIKEIPLKEVAGKLKLITKDDDLFIQGKRMGVCFG